MQSKRKEITCNIPPLVPLRPLTTHTTSPWRKTNSLLKIKSGPRLTITLSPFSSRHTCVRATLKIQPLWFCWSARQRQLFLSASFPCGFWHHMCGWTNAVLNFLVTCSVWVFAVEPVPLGISGGDWLVPFVIAEFFKVQVQWVWIPKNTSSPKPS